MKNKHFLFSILALLIIAGAAAFFLYPKLSNSEYGKNAVKNDIVTAEEAKKEELVTHIKTPDVVKAVYLSSWAAATPSFRKNIGELIDTTEINAVVIDVKDYTGKIAFPVNNPELLAVGSSERRIRDIDAFLADLHSRNIYVIGRVAVFQDPFYSKKHPEIAVKRKSDTSITWSDKKGQTWVDAGNRKMWEYTALVAQESYARGFDEINFDYIRFPSDGNMKDIYFPASNGISKAETMKSFFMYLDTNVRQKGIPTSADLFGLTTTVNNDMNIGQVLENAAPYFDFIAPMVYPSHYPNGWNGFKNPAQHPYEVINLAMKGGVEKLKAIGEDPQKLRPWLQDFDLGATYTADMVRAQMKAAADNGLDSWMLWDPSNKYTKAALKAE